MMPHFLINAVASIFMVFIFLLDKSDISFILFVL